MVPAALLDALRDQPDPVEPFLEPVEEHGQERHRRQHGHERNQKAREPEAAHERQRHEQHQREADGDGGTAEHDRATRCLHRPRDGLFAAAPGPMLLAIAVDHEQRVVDRDPEPDQHHEVREIGRQLHEVREDPEEPERDRDRRCREQQGKQERERAEDEDQDRHRDRNRDVELADLEVVGKDGVEVVLDRRLAGDVGARPRNRPGGLPHRVGVALRVGRVQARDDGRRDDVARHGVDGRHLSRRQRACGAVGSGAHLRHELRSLAGRSLDHDRERALRLLAEVRLEDGPGLVALGAGQDEPVREQIGEAGRGRSGSHHGNEPDGEHRPAKTDHRSSPARHASPPVVVSSG